MEKLRYYLKVPKLLVITGHYSLVWLDNLKDPQGRLRRPQKYHFDVKGT